MPDLDEAGGIEPLHGLAEHRAADAELIRQLLLRWQGVAGVKRAILQIGDKLVERFLGQRPFLDWLQTASHGSAPPVLHPSCSRHGFGRAPIWLHRHRSTHPPPVAIRSTMRTVRVHSGAGQVRAARRSLRLHAQSRANCRKRSHSGRRARG